jgi:glycosyltransferase involved in cell wall biosynthesis
VPWRAQRRLRVLLCSGLGRNKDYGGALRLFARSHALRDAELHIVGFGRDAYLARRRLERYPASVAKRVVVLPRLSLDELVTEYLASDLVWVHSQSEGFGRCVIEARLAGRPVVASNIGAFRRLMGPGVTLYRNSTFDAAVTKTFAGEPVPPLSAIAYHAKLEAAVGEFVALYSAPLPREEPVD